MAACFALLGRRSKLAAMFSIAVHHSRHHAPRLIQSPLLFRRARRSIGELAGLVWVATEVARLVRSRVDAPRSRPTTRVRERSTWWQ